ncbi:hypothetical protein [Sunxiuqinia indica]|uniref:hypothetical protein n=1 Tax=Sunxiuqinia indica TaxID=2692584 RepID=UPI0013587CEA|nr:hypothetical protein [Sunxiuqinia indica]
MENKKSKFDAGSPLSGILFQNLRYIYFTELKKGLKEKISRNKYHIQSQQSITAFPLAIAVWESLLNEVFLSDIVRHHYRDNLLVEISNEAERWDLKTKTLMYPKFLFGKTFDKTSHNFANFQTIAKIRNDIIHYKFSLYEGPDKAMKNLRSLNVSYPKPKDVKCPWHMEIETSECVRFCINTISILVGELFGLQTEFYKGQCGSIYKEIYKGISEDEINAIFNEYGIDPISVHEDMFGNNRD